MSTLAGEPVKEAIHMTKGRRIFVMQCGFHAIWRAGDWRSTIPITC